MDAAAPAARRIVEIARSRLASTRSSVSARNRNRAMVESVVNPMRRSPRADAAASADLDHETRRLYSDLVRDLVRADVRSPGTSAIAATALGLTGMETSGTTPLVRVLDGNRMPVDRWIAATGRSHAGVVARRFEDDLARIVRGSLAPRPTAEPAEDAPAAPAP